MRFLTKSMSVLGLSLAVCAQVLGGEVLDRVMSDKVVVLSTDAEYPPQSSLDENN